ncbi:MAG: DinB family protein [Streptosporangiaceae bacterium]
MAEAGERETVPERWNAVGAGSNMWMDMSLDPRFTDWKRPESERATLVEFLRRYRLVMEMKCADLDAAQLASRSVPPSTMSLLGLIRHMADVERYWFRVVMAQSDVSPLYWLDDVPDADWLGAVADPAFVDDAWRAWRGEVAFAEKFVADAPDLGTKGFEPDGSSPALRSVLVHMIEEYARHCGHADLLRERIDGRVGQ